MKGHYLLLIVAIIVLAFLILFPQNTEQKEVDFTTTAKISVGSSVFNVDIADSQRERTLGLSGRENISGDGGLFFIFDDENRHGIWMKDMNFAIDIIWADKNFEIVHIERGISPNTFPKVFYPQKDAIYVLETAANSIKKEVKIGDKIIFEKNDEF